MAFVSEQTRSLIAATSPGFAERRGCLRFASQLPVLPLAILIPFVLIALFANVIAPYDPTEPIPGAKSLSRHSGSTAPIPPPSSAPTSRGATS